MKLLDTKDVAKLLRCSKGQVSKLVNGKVKRMPKLRCIRIGHNIRFNPDSVDDYLKSLEREDNGTRT